jgi:hypothetical protein
VKQDRRKNFFLTFHPICETAIGRIAVSDHGTPPFIDGSCRREPDLESDPPTFTELCRPGDGPRFEVGNRILYATIKNPNVTCRGWGLVAALEVIKVHASHEEAARWFRDRKLRLPSNYIGDGNPCKPLHLTTGLPADHGNPQQQWSQSGKPPGTLAEWDAHYKHRASTYAKFAVCKHLQPPRLRDAPFYISELKQCFESGEVPITRFRGARISDAEFENVATLMSRARSSPISN